MTPNAWIAIAGLSFTILLAVISGVVWLVRLEGKAEANRSRLSTLETSIASHAVSADQSRVEIVRLQEQIKHLTDLIERWLTPAPRARAPKGD